VVGTDENGKVTDAPVVIRDEAATDSDDGDIKLSSKKPVLAVRLFEIAIREKGEKNPTDGRTAVHKSNLKEIILREQRRGSNATDASRESMVRRIIGDIRTKFADEVGEYFYPKAANDNIRTSEPVSRNMRTKIQQTCSREVFAATLEPSGTHRPYRTVTE
jgi:hypothetical protein